jgi:hypothetical protein
MRLRLLQPARGRAMARLIAVVGFVLPAAVACGAAPAARPSSAALAIMIMQPPQPGTSPIVGPVTGTGPRTFTVTVRRAMGVQLSCLAYSGRAPWIWINSALTPADVKCQAPGGTATGGALYRPPRDEIGTRVTLRVAAPPGTTWLLRVDGSRT